MNPRPIAQVVAVEPEGPDGHGVNWLAGPRPKPGDLLYRAADLDQVCAQQQELLKARLVLGSENIVLKGKQAELLAALTALLNDPAVIEAAQPGDIGRALMATREDL
jgi:hypothetical protein